MFQNIPAPPPGYVIDPNDPTRAIPASQANSPFGGRPIIQQMPTPKDQADLTRAQQDIAAQPLQNESTRVGIEQNRQSMQNQRFNQNQGLRQEYSNLPITKNYNTILQTMAGALKAPDTAQGDLAVLYANATTMDPGSVVRESEQEMAKNTASRFEQLKKQYNLGAEGARLPAGVRDGLIESARQKIAAVNAFYNQSRHYYEDLAKRNKMDPFEVVGPHAGDTFRTIEEDYIRAHGGVPKVNGVPVGDTPVSTAVTRREFGAEQDPRVSELTPEQSAAYQAWWKANPKPSPEQLVQFFGTMHLNVPVERAKEIIDAKRAGRGLSSTIEAKPDISDVRTGNNRDDMMNALVRGVPDVLSMGALDKVVAAGDTIFKGGTFDQNLGRQYAITDYDQEHHPFARLGGQMLGGGLLPMGEISNLANLSLKGGAYGAGYGLGSSRSLEDVPVNMITGGALGAAVPAALGKIFPRVAGKPEPLVDPLTGELNAPMDAMSPAQRMQAMRDAGLNHVSPGMAGGRSARIIDQVMNNLPASAGHMEDFNAAASKELRGAMQGVAQQFGNSKTLNEGGTALQRGAKQYMDRAEGVANKLYDRIPISDAAPSNLTNTTGTLQQLSNKFSSNPEMAEMLNNPKFSQYLQALQRGGLSWRDLKDFRSMVGDKIGTMRFGENDNTGDFRALYAALSEDMRNTAAAHPGGLKAFERANGFYQQKEALIEDALTRILGPDAKANPERAAAAVQAMTQGGKAGGDIKTLAQIRAATVKSGAWDEIASTLIHLGGQPAKSEGRAFQPQTFVNWYADMSEPARALLFKPELRKSLDGFVAMTQQLGRVKALNNTSNTGPLVLGGGVLMQAAHQVATGDLKGLAYLLGANAVNWGAGKVWTNPTFVNLITGYGRASIRGNQNAIRSQVGRLAKFAAENPEFSAPVQSFLQHVANDNAPQAGRLVASPDEGPDEQQRRYPY